MPDPRFVDGHVLHPDPYYAPAYRISPFRTSDAGVRPEMRREAGAAFLNRKFAERGWILTHHGKEAIAIALTLLRLSPDDVVTIHTTTENMYISGCVTREIEKVCKWSRKLEATTRALFVNHEFGFPHEQLAELARLGLPIIEDCCHSFESQSSHHDAGKLGDFAVYSLPKFFPMQMGGILSFDKKWQPTSPCEEPLSQYLLDVLGNHAPHVGDKIAKRRESYSKLQARFQRLGLAPRFSLEPWHVPGVFMFKTPPGTDLPELKRHVWAHGIESSVFYGEDAFFIPCHERLTDSDIEYFALVVDDYFTSKRS